MRRPSDLSPMPEDARVIDEIRASGADVVWVGLRGCQARKNGWRLTSKHLPPQCLSPGLGPPSISMQASVRQALQMDAATWVLSGSTDWPANPRRLWRRYLKTIPAFMVAITFEQR